MHRQYHIAHNAQWLHKPTVLSSQSQSRWLSLSNSPALPHHIPVLFPYLLAFYLFVLYVCHSFFVLLPPPHSFSSCPPPVLLPLPFFADSHESSHSCSGFLIEKKKYIKKVISTEFLSILQFLQYICSFFFDVSSISEWETLMSYFTSIIQLLLLLSTFLHPVLNPCSDFCWLPKWLRAELGQRYKPFGKRSVVDFPKGPMISLPISLDHTYMPEMLSFPYHNTKWI